MGKRTNLIITNAAAILVCAILMFVLMRFLAIPTWIPGTNINLGIAVLAIFAAIFGPVAGFLTGFIGHALVDLSWGFRDFIAGNTGFTEFLKSAWWSWVLASAFFGLAVGFFRKFYQIEAGDYGVKQALIFNGIQIAANIIAYAFIARILDLLFYDEAFDKVSLQSFTAAIINIAVVLVIGTLVIMNYYKNKTIRGDRRDESTRGYKDVKELFKAVGTWLLLGMFLVSSFITLLVSELVNRQMISYEETVIEMTNYRMEAVALSLARLVSAEELDLFHVFQDRYKPEYQEIRERLIKFGEDYDVKFAYYWRPDGKGNLLYIIDNDTDPMTQVYPGQSEKIQEDVEFAALEGKVGVTDVGSYSAEWEGLLSAVAPVYDKDGNIYCVAGVDIEDEFILKQREDSQSMKLRLLIIVPIAVIFGILNMMLFRRKAIQIEEAHIKLQYFNNNMRRAFSTYLSEDVVEEIVSDPSRLQLGGEKKHMTALFTDVKGFTSIAEKLSPEQLVDLLNYYLSTMSDIILEQKGTIDKYQGDAIISFFGAPLNLPDHALRACVTAISMRRMETEINKHVAENNLSPNPMLTRFGINSGEMVVGNMGTHKKMNYTIISNAVNLASRLEGVNKQYGTWILASEDTVKETRGHLLTRRLDRIRVVGINEPVRIYEILEMAPHAPHALHKKVAAFEEALKTFEERKWQEAEAAFTQILRAYPDDAPSKLYITRCRKFKDYPPADDWDGVFNFAEK